MRKECKSSRSQPRLSFSVIQIKAIIPLLVLVLTVCLEIKNSLLTSSVGITEYHPKVIALTKKKWAVMMIGAGRTYMLSRNSFIQNVVKQSYPPMDVFVFTKNISDSSCLVDLESLRLLELDSTAIKIDTNHLDLNGRNIWKISEDRLVRQHTESFQMIDDYAEKENISYEFIFFTRPDLYYTLPFNTIELENKFKDVTDGIIFSPQCCAWGGWCDQVAAAPYQDFARMIRVGREWVSRGGSNEVMADGTNPETLFRARGQFANLSSFDMRLKEDYGFFLLRLNSAKEACVESHDYISKSGSDTVCGSFAPFEFNATLEVCEILNTSSLCDVGSYAG
jgi:hypothetical protein